MANAGYSHDYKVLRDCIKDSKLLKISETEHFVIQEIKRKINTLVLLDEVGTARWNKYKYTTHTAYKYMQNVLFVANKLRQQNWFWEQIKV